jgi:hypothetical protein
MSIDIKELYKSDLDPASPSLWWSSKKIEKLNWNFDQIELFDGGPYGPQGFEGSIGFEGATGSQGASGVRGFQGIQGVIGGIGFNDWTINTKVNGTNTTIKYKEVKTNPANYRIGFADTDTEYAENDSSVAVKRFNTKTAEQPNLIFIASNIGAGNTNISSREHFYYNLYANIDNTGAQTSTILDSGFQNVSDSNWKFRLSPTVGAKFSFFTPKSSPTQLLELSATAFTPKVASIFDNVSTINGTVKIAGNIYGANGTGKIAATAYDTSGQLGTVMWKEVNEVLPIFPIGSIIAVDKEFTSQYFNLEKTGTVSNLAEVAGYGSFTPTFKFEYGAGLASGKFKGWYLCNGKTWYKGSVSYNLPNLCSFDLTVDYPTYSSSLLTPPVSGYGSLTLTTTNRQHLGTAQVGFKADEVGAPGYYTYTNGTAGQTKVKESYIDLGEPLVTIYGGATTSNQLNTSTGKGDGLLYLCFLGEDGFIWDTSATAPSVNTITLGYDSAGYGAACGASTTAFDCNFLTSTWTETSSWTTNDNKLYITNSSTLADTGWYAKNGIVRYWNKSLAKFALRLACPSYTSTELVYNSAAINAGINGAFSGLSKSTYYINGSSLSNSTSLFTNSSGTTQASAGWYRDSGSRRYWSGTNFQGAIFTADYVNVIDAYSPLGYDTSSTGACNASLEIYGYYQNSIATSQTFSAISNLFVGDSSAGSGVINYADAAYYYSNGSVYRKCNNSSTGALNSAVSCSYSPSPTPTPGPSGGGGGCVLFGTKITMNDGTIKQVQDLVVGDKLSSRSVNGMPVKETSALFKWNSSNIELSNEDVYVKSVQTHHVNVVLSFNDGKLFTSKDHLHLFKSNGIWKISVAVDLKIGDFLLGEDGKEIEIASIVETKGQYIVYKLDVEENDLFIANGILTHNLKDAEQYLNQE